MFLYIIAPVKLLCDNIGSSPSGSGGRRILDESSLSSGLGDFNAVIEGLNTALESVASTLTDYIANYKNYIIKLSLKLLFILFIIFILSL
jgi:hypothetical protein